MSYQNIPLDAFATTFGQTTGERRLSSPGFFADSVFIGLELSSVALGGKVVNVSDEFFAAAFHLLLVEVSRSALAQCPSIHGFRLRSTES